MDTAIVVLYFLFMIFIGAISAKGVKGITGFFVADRGARQLIVSGSLFATIIGGSSTIGMAGLGYSRGLVGAWWLLVGALGLLFLGLFLAEKVRGYSLYTLPEIFELQYGAETKVIASCLIVLAWTGIIAGQIVAAGKILGALYDAPSSLLMVIVAFIFIAYTLLGGQVSILRTDSIQSLIILIAIVIVAPLCLYKAGGIVSMKAALGKDYFSFPTNSHFPLKALFTYLILVGSTYLVGPDIYSRLFCARDKKVAKRSAIIVSLSIIPFAFMITLIGMSARILFPQILPEAAFPSVIHHLLPAGLSGIVIAALLAAMMSSADTCLLTTSAILTMDITKPLVRSPMNEKNLLLLSRCFIVIIGLISLFVALRLKGVISSLLLGYTVYTSGLVLPILLGFYRNYFQLNKTGAILAMTVGGCFALIGKIGGFTDFGLYGF
ncbi:MAG: sodium:solute symporter family protein, partial [Pseudomonadota bacterium]